MKQCLQKSREYSISSKIAQPEFVRSNCNKLYATFMSQVPHKMGFCMYILTCKVIFNITLHVSMYMQKPMMQSQLSTLHQKNNIYHKYLVVKQIQCRFITAHLNFLSNDKTSQCATRLPNTLHNLHRRDRGNLFLIRDLIRIYLICTTQVFIWIYSFSEQNNTGKREQGRIV